MDEGWFFLILILGLALIITVGIITNEVSETPYDKCLDKCDSLSKERNPEIFLECVKDCNINFKQNREGGKEYES